MKLAKKILLSTLHHYGTLTSLVAAVIIFASLTAPQHTTQVQNTHSGHTTTISHAPQTPKKTTPPPTTQPTPEPKTTTPTATPKPAPQPTTPPPSVAAVSSAAASPGTGVSSLTQTSTPPANTSSAPPSGTGTMSSFSSSNWAGYMVSGATYTKVSGSWIAPTPTGNGRSTTADAAWIGIGGVSSDDLIQVGTENTVTASGQIDTAVFYELLPDAPIYPATISVSAGDSISASINETSHGQWVITLSDLTNGQVFTTSVSYASSYSSAEWIEEDPSFSNGSLVPFSFTGSMGFTQAFATANGVNQNIASGTAGSITLVSRRGTPLVTPSALGSDGASFTVTHS